MPQPIQVDAELSLGTQPLAPRDDDILHVLDYRKVRQIIIDECTAEHVNLLESLIGKLAQRLMQLPGVMGVRVKIAKLEILTTAKWPFASRQDNGEPHERSDRQPLAGRRSRRRRPRRHRRRQPHQDRARADQARKRLCREVGRAITDFNMIEEGDKIMVCMSGGKDSYTMLDVLRKLQKRAPVKFELVAVNLDQKQPGFPDHVLPEYFKSIGVDYHIETQDTYSVVKRVVPEGKTTCGLCSRLRRAILYKVADELGCTKVALGHHRDDIVQTLMLNMFYGGRMKGMPRSWSRTTASMW